jgi:hypothetical protein
MKDDRQSRVRFFQTMTTKRQSGGPPSAERDTVNLAPRSHVRCLSRLASQRTIEPHSPIQPGGVWLKLEKF